VRSCSRKPGGNSSGKRSISMEFPKYLYINNWPHPVDIRYVVTSLKGSAQHLYENVYCQRGQMENLIKLHKAQLASDRMSCHSAMEDGFQGGFRFAKVIPSPSKPRQFLKTVWPMSRKVHVQDVEIDTAATLNVF
jgi:Transposase DDE domain group 1